MFGKSQERVWRIVERELETCNFLLYRWEGISQMKSTLPKVIKFMITFKVFNTKYLTIIVKQNI
jgi:hypothetical protein